MILLLLITSCSAVNSKNIDLITFLDQTLEHFQSETFALVNFEDELSMKTSRFICYRVNFPQESIAIDHGSVRECSLILIDETHLKPVRFVNTIL